jgi:hypothetical protein
MNVRLLVLLALSCKLFAANPIITNVFTADPAPLVVGDTVYLYVGQDEAVQDQDGYRLNRWLVYSSTNMADWVSHGSPLKPADFSWSSGKAYAAHVTEKDDKYYFFVSTGLRPRAMGIGVAVSDSPTGTFRDAIGKPLITADMTPDRRNHGWEDIDPAVFTDTDGVTYLFWGNETCYWAKLKPNLIELDGKIHAIPAEQVKGYTEAPWIHKRGGFYYLTYAQGFPEKTAYSMSTRIIGPWEYKGVLAEVAGNSTTIHQGIIHFKGRDYFFYHNGALQHLYDDAGKLLRTYGGGNRRSVCIDYLYYNDDGTLKRVVQTSEGVGPVEPDPAKAIKQANPVPTEKDMAAYLMVYFKDETHGVYMALSSDGYSFTDVNNGQPVFEGHAIALQKGVRDPHISRGPDGMFYLVMTDLHIYGQRAGYRDTEWERPGSNYGWGNNRALVLMKSTDLINWSRTNLRVDKAFDGLENIGCAWAPQTLYDPDKDKMMLYYSMRFGNDLNRIYYTYMNDDFTRMETYPELLFEYPKDVSYIDGDITRVGDQYHLFYVPHDGRAGIKHAVSDAINSGYVYRPAWVDLERVSCEAPNLWKRIGQDVWVLMYDVYRAQPNNMGFSETSDFQTFTNLGHFNRGVMKGTNFERPKHGAVVHLSAAEARRLADHWGIEYY